MIKVLIEGMSCDHCVNEIQKVVSKLAGVISVEIRVAEKAIYIEGTPLEEEVKEAILEIGYDVISVE